jgi:hypothetical protein
LWDSVRALISDTSKTVKERWAGFDPLGDRLNEQLWERKLMAIGGSTFSDIGGGISDLFAVSADRSKAQGDYFEAQNYDLAAKYADQPSSPGSRPPSSQCRASGRPISR